MKTKQIIIAGLLAITGLVGAVGAQAQTSAQTNGTNTNQSGSESSNLGNNLTNNFLSPSDSTEHVHYSGVTGSNTPVGLGSFSSSFSSDYCGGVAQAGASVPYVTLAFGKPVLGDPGVACVDTRASVHTMEFAATFGNAADRALSLAAKFDSLAHPTPVIVSKTIGKTVVNTEQPVLSASDAAQFETQAAEARQQAFNYAKTSEQLATAAIYMQCNLSDDVRKAYRDAGFSCPKTDAEKKADADAAAAKQQQAAQVNNEPTDPLVRSRLGLPPLQ